MWNLGTSLSYTSNLYGVIEARIERPLHGVDGMPFRAAYEADQGWDDLFAPKAKKPLVRRGATAFDSTADRASGRSSAQDRPEEHTDER